MAIGVLLIIILTCINDSTLRLRSGQALSGVWITKVVSDPTKRDAENPGYL